MKVPYRVILSNPIYCLAFGFGSGLSPKAPGTFGTLAAIPFYLILTNFPAWVYAFLVGVAFFLGIWVCGKTSRYLGVKDHSGIVWDEFVGYWITMFLAPVGWSWMLLGFCLFRVLDILKPWPIKYIDKNVKGGLGIMLDDVLAGIMAALFIQAAVILTG